MWAVRIDDHRNPCAADVAENKPMHAPGEQATQMREGKHTTAAVVAAIGSLSSCCCGAELFDSASPSTAAATAACKARLAYDTDPF